MSEKDPEFKRGRRAAVVILGGLAVGAVLSGSAAVADPDTPIRDQFSAAYVAGPAAELAPNTVQIVLGD